MTTADSNPLLPPGEIAPTAAVLVAAGTSSRMGRIDGRRKPLVLLEGQPVLERACAAFAAVAAVTEIIVVTHREDLEAVRELARGSEALARVSRVIEGGAERIDSVRAGIEATAVGAELVAIHDAARPLIEASVIEAALATATREGAALVAVPATDTVKHSSDGRRAEKTLDRSRLWFAQTPQVFRRGEFLELLERARAEGLAPTDDAGLYEHYVGPVPLVPGSATNLKLTTPTDLQIAAALLRARTPPREERT